MFKSRIFIFIAQNTVKFEGLILINMNKNTVKQKRHRKQFI